jgi:hypothetical protein
VRVPTSLSVAVFVASVAVACGGDDTGQGGSSSGTQPSSCATPCTPGALCYQPDPGSSCNGDWYCWNDAKWYCAPPDSGGPGDATVTFETGAVEAGDDGTTAAGDGEAGAD